MNAETAALIERFAAGADQVAAVVADLPAGALSTRPSADEWSVAEVLAHIADAEIIAGERYRRIIADPEAVLHPLFQVDWATHLHYERRDPQLAAATFRAMRVANAEILRLIPPEAWERTGRHLLTGPSTLRDQVQQFTDHTDEHIAQLEAMRQ